MGYTQLATLLVSVSLVFGKVTQFGDGSRHYADATETLEGRTSPTDATPYISFEGNLLSPRGYWCVRPDTVGAVSCPGHDAIVSWIVVQSRAESIGVVKKKVREGAQ